MKASMRAQHYIEIGMLIDRSSKSMYILLGCCVTLFLVTAILLNTGWSDERPDLTVWRNPLSWLLQPIQPITQHPATGKRTLSMLIAERVRVFCWILTSPNRHSTFASAVNATWAPYCNAYAFMSTQEDPTLPNLVKLTGVEDGREHVWSRTKAAFRHIYEHHIDDYDWFMRVDDDGYIVLENLRFFLLAYDPDEKIYHGCRLKNHANWVHLEAGYMQGGVGYALSRAALRAFIEDGLDTGKCSEIIDHTQQKDGDTPYEDVEIGGCLAKLGVAPSDSRDAAGKHRFMSEAATSHLTHEKVIDTRIGLWRHWYPLVQVGWRLEFGTSQLAMAEGSLQGPECCSDYSVGFHHMSPNKMHLVHFLIYRLRPYGADLVIDSAGGGIVDEETLLLAAYQSSVQEMGPDEARNKSWGKAPTALPVYLRPKTQRAKKPSRNITTSTAKTTSL